MRSRFPTAFTLIELLAVMGVIALMAGVAGLSLREGRPAVALQSAQGALAGLLSAARGRAALSQCRTTLIVDADSRSEGYLRDIQIVVQSRSNPGQWVRTAEGMMLPRGVYVVPAPAMITGITLGSGPENWPAGRWSTLQPAPAGSISVRAGDQAGTYLMMSQSFGFTGASVMDEGVKFVVSPARRTPAGLIFGNPDWVSGFALSSYGQTIFINDGAGFDF